MNIIVSSYFVSLYAILSIKILVPGAIVIAFFSRFSETVEGNLCEKVHIAC